MRTEMVVKPETLARAYLKQLQELNAEVEIAMEAIGANALSTLEESVARQQALCAHLQRLTGEARLQAKAAAGGLGEDASLAHRIQVARESLTVLNLRYAALLRHSAHTVRLLSGLCRGYTEHFQPAPALRTAQPSWSCRL